VIEKRNSGDAGLVVNGSNQPGFGQSASFPLTAGGAPSEEPQCRTSHADIFVTNMSFILYHIQLHSSTLAP